MRRTVIEPVGLWCAVVAVHVWLGWVALSAPGWPLGDVQFVYSFWADQVIETGTVVGIDTAWVYPPLALVPVLLPAIAGMANYPVAWLVMVGLLDAAAIGVLTGWGRRRDRRRIAWWWLGFLLLLGPIAVGRLDAVTAALGVAAAATVLTRPTVASALLSAGVWIKVWPAGILAAAIVALRSRLTMLATAIGVSVLVLVSGVLLGGGASLLSFLLTQADRGLQVEAVLATPWVWAVALGAPGVSIGYDSDIITFQVSGPGVDLMAAATTPLLVVAVAVVLVLAALAIRRGVAPTRVLASAGLATTAALIVANKVGSPQFSAWLAVPVVLALVVLHDPERPGSAWRRWRAPIAIVTAIAALTQLIYPTFYDAVLAAQPVMVVVLTIRNLATIALLCWAVTDLVRAARTTPTEGAPS